MVERKEPEIQRKIQHSRVLGFAWMASGGSPQHVCGVVLIRDPIEGEKAYIGLKMASEEKADLLWIKAHGNKFSTKIAKEIIYRVGKWL